MNPVTPIFTIDLLPQLHAELLALLKSLSDEDWNKPTVARAWSVKDIAAHLLDGDLRRLSLQRDQAPLPQPESPLASYGELTAFLNRLNAEWVQAAKRLSPRILIGLLEWSGEQVGQFFKTLDPYGTAPFAVAWAGEETSLNWFDTAREYTERWHHQQQIRDAVGASGLTSRKWLHPVLDTFLRALPHAYREVRPNEGTLISFEVTGEAGGEWTFGRENGAWHLYAGSSQHSACQVRLDQDTAWRMMTKGLPRDQAAARLEIGGEQSLGTPILGMLAVMA
ncbi:MAG: maleylpyruvate isomerase family mycothiol-dependent enzyme [bacterium]